MPTYRVEFRPETALASELIEATGIEIMTGEGMAVFEPVIVEGRYARPSPMPLRFILQITEFETGRVVYPVSGST